MKLDVLAFGSHPDDVELGCGATLAKCVFEGKKVGILDLTYGELGTRGGVSIREKESEKASEILGIALRENAGFADGFFVNDKQHQLKIIEILRKYQPDLVFCNALEDRHIDHSKGAKLVIHACFLSGLVKVQTQINGKNQRPWRPKQIFHYIQWQPVAPDFVVEVSDFMHIKQKAVAAYKSQFYNPHDDKAPQTPISSKNFLESVIYRAKDFGRLVGVDYAEGFTAHGLLKVSDVFDII